MMKKTEKRNLLTLSLFLFLSLSAFVLFIGQASALSVVLTSPADSSTVTPIGRYFNATLDTEGAAINSFNRTNGFTPSQTTSLSSVRGHEIIVNFTNVSVWSVTRTTSATSTRVRICTGSTSGCSGDTLGTATFVGETATFTEPVNLSGNGTYYVVVDNSGSAYTTHYNGDAGIYPVVVPEFRWSRFNDGGSLGTTGTNEIIAINVSNQSGGSSPYQAQNATLYVYTNAGALVGTNFTTVVTSNKTNFSMPILTDATYKWNVDFCNSNSQCFFAPANYSYTQDATSPKIAVITPLNNTYLYSSNSSYTTFEFNISNIDSVGAGSCYYNTTYNSAVTFVACNKNTQVNVTNTFGKHQFYVFGNDTAGNTVMNQTTLWIHRNIYENFTFETDSNIFLLELWNLSTTPTTAVLNYSNTNYSGSIATLAPLGGGKYNLSATIDIPIGVSSKAFSWFFIDDSVQRQSNTSFQTVQNTSFNICTPGNGLAYLNLTFKNETVAQENLNGSLSTSTFSFWLGSGAINKTYTFASTPVNRNYTFCFNPQNQSVTVDSVVNYYNAESVQRTFTGLFSLSNTTTQKVLYLLPTSIGSYVTFQVVNPAQQPLSGAFINITSSTYGGISGAYTDDSGSATFFLNPLETYSLSVSLTGYPTFLTTIVPTQSQYTISLGGSSTTSSVIDTYQGILAQILPLGPYLNNNTYYLFNFSINSSFWTIDEFGMTLRNSSGSVFGTTSSTASGGLISLNRSTGDNSTLFVDVYWLIDGNYTNYTKVYVIYDASRSDTSLANLRDRIRTYITNGGIFGLEPFGLNIIVFLVIFVTTGIFSWKFGITSPAAVLGMMFVMTMIFDYMNLITYATSLPEDAASFAMGIVTFAAFIKEAMT